MGWLEWDCRPEDKKTEVEHYLGDSIIKTVWVGSTCYAAYRSKNGDIHGLVAITRSGNGRVAVKEITEDMGPGECKCPNSILKLLSPTTDVYALEWRKRCQEHNARPKLGKLPIGSRIAYKRWDGVEVTAQKMAPNHQFKTTWWWHEGTDHYISKKNIPEEFTVL